MLNYTVSFRQIHSYCLSGTADGIDQVMCRLNSADLPVTRAIDFYLGMVDSDPAVKRIEYYLFNGTQIQRNYCTLYFARRNEWKLINEAYEQGLVDAVQAYSR